MKNIYLILNDWLQELKKAKSDAISRNPHSSAVPNEVASEFNSWAVEKLIDAKYFGPIHTTGFVFLDEQDLKSQNVKEFTSESSIIQPPTRLKYWIFGAASLIAIILILVFVVAGKHADSNVGESANFQIHHPIRITGDGELRGLNGKIYSYWNVDDEDLNSWWTPANPKNGKNASITLFFGTKLKINGIRFHPGSHYLNYPKYGDLFKRNNRVSRASLAFSDGTTLNINPKDKDEIQEFTFPVEETEFLTLTIVGVLPGTEWNDACISELKAFYRK